MSELEENYAWQITQLADGSEPIVEIGDVLKGQPLKLVLDLIGEEAVAVGVMMLKTHVDELLPMPKEELDEEQTQGNDFYFE